VQFSVYRPKTIQPGLWYPLLAFAHLAARREDEPGAPDPIEEVHRQAAQFLQDDLAAYHQSTDDSAQPVPREGELRFVPAMDGIEFNPSERRFRWEEPVHREEFRLRASPLNVPRVARGRLTVFLGSVILAEVNLAIACRRNPSTRRLSMRPPPWTVRAGSGRSSPPTRIVTKPSSRNSSSSRRRWAIATCGT
jgi:hypothetical protein